MRYLGSLMGSGGSALGYLRIELTGATWRTSVLYRDEPLDKMSWGAAGSLPAPRHTSWGKFMQVLCITADLPVLLLVKDRQ